MAFNKEKTEFQETVISINRCTAVTKGGKNLSFSALVAVGNGKGTVGYGFGKAREVPSAVSKAVKDAMKQTIQIPFGRSGDTLPHEVWGHYGASRVFMKPASGGTGIKAGGTVRAILEAAGVKNILTKCYGSRNPINIVKATINGLRMLRTREQIEKLRESKIE
ncbi:MAG TPA: 30S ribosomal protein S5 [Candidatus Brocadiia bacterium]|nr:30S ribosomal protein S5 [Planctomycetota bacterium]MDO8092448.1 30S ribosomal protein S5 [Candidatus Brocadiales bacterium]